MNLFRKMNAATIAVAVAACTLLSAPGRGVAAPDPGPLANKYNCLACHALDKKVVGPSFKEIAAKYASDPGAQARLEKKVKAGGSGVWGAIPMPPNNVPEADLKPLVESILSAK